MPITEGSCHCLTSYVYGCFCQPVCLLEMPGSPPMCAKGLVVELASLYCQLVKFQTGKGLCKYWWHQDRGSLTHSWHPTLLRSHVGPHPSHSTFQLLNSMCERVCRGEPLVLQNLTKSQNIRIRVRKGVLTSTTAKTQKPEYQLLLGTLSYCLFYVWEAVVWLWPCAGPNGQINAFKSQ